MQIVKSSPRNKLRARGVTVKWGEGCCGKRDAVGRAERGHGRGVEVFWRRGEECR